ncbi:MAG: hypothetical protein AVDCRST_MAG48-1838 [uncultured Friedmanniella sp.]|uniref:Uncharacterized protein n=1 Tax=uncultured Friedmanniella sp. TaxID=335381 RepID=A0A6J4KK76_9ACTN|nr:MAG: hypothetical protein AVDCRST_MAG48-1838 [uncultured Friedmanniella sp.]
MSKVDAQRAMREARYARDNPDGPVRGRGSTGEAPAAPAARPATRTPSARPTADAPADPSSPAPGPDGAALDSGLCGHKSMNGRACTREAGHPQKSHRYG